MGFFDSLVKPFKAVWNVTKKILPYALAAAAIVFTAGAAIPSLGAAMGMGAGGWLGAASSLTSAMGLTGTLGTIATSALYQAGFGAVIGGAISGITGGDITKGMQMGALGGAVSGGITGALSDSALTGVFDFEKTGANTLAGVPTEINNTGGLNVGSDASVFGQATAPGVPDYLANVPNAATTATPATGLGGGWTPYQGGNMPVGNMTTGSFLSGGANPAVQVAGTGTQGITNAELLAALGGKEPFWQKAGIQALGSAGGALATAAAGKDKGYVEYAKQQQDNLIANSPRPGSYGLGVSTAQPSTGKVSVYDPRTGKYYYAQAAGAA
jgi:hypothetical protein